MNIEQEATRTLLIDTQEQLITANNRLFDSRNETHEVQAAFDAFRREVSETVQRHIDKTDDDCSALWRAVTRGNLQHLIIPGPVDPLVKAIAAASWVIIPEGEDSDETFARELRAELAKIGGKVVFGEI